ncbi:MAG: dihydroorotate dehydrogenase electron transfer subunit [Planctomycetota bacterium]|nr:dihydroorotate dehydrogenase electron transfer subunit [Planctomycetota bacterium]
MPGLPLPSQNVDVLAKETLGGGYSRIVVGAPEMARRARPGQFAMIRPRPGTDPLLNRPFSFYDVDPEAGTVTFLCLDLGLGSRLIGQMREGDRILLIGPLGNTFVPPERGRAVFVAGGVGVAPFLHLGKELGGGTLLFGGRNRGAIVDIDALEAAGIEVLPATDDGSLGRKGFVTDLLHEHLEKRGHDVTLYGCGPNPMLRILCQMAIEKDIPCQVSIDQKMACGFGTCMGCMVMTTDGYRKVCTAGPVFEARDLAW